MYICVSFGGGGGVGVCVCLCVCVFVCLYLWNMFTFAVVVSASLVFMLESSESWRWYSMEGSNAKQQSVCDTLSQWVQKERLYRSEVLLAINDIIDYQWLRQSHPQGVTTKRLTYCWLWGHSDHTCPHTVWSPTSLQSDEQCVTADTWNITFIKLLPTGNRHKNIKQRIFSPWVDRNVSNPRMIKKLMDRFKGAEKWHN